MARYCALSRESLSTFKLSLLFGTFHARNGYLISKLKIEKYQLDEFLNAHVQYTNVRLQQLRLILPF